MDPSARWDREPPATRAAIEALRRDSPVPLPGDYLEFLMISNGGYGPLPVSPLGFNLWPAEEVIEWNQSYEREEYYADLFLIGWLDSNVFAFQLLDGVPGGVVALDYLDGKRECVDRLGETFTDFVAMLGRESPVGG
jgi:hypothetical protein